MYHHGTTRYIFGHSYVYTNVNHKIPSLASRNTHQLFLQMKGAWKYNSSRTRQGHQVLDASKGYEKNVMGCENIFGKLRGAKIYGQKIRGVKKRQMGAKIFWKNLRGAKIPGEKIRGAKISTEKIRGVKFFAIFQKRLRPGIRTWKWPAPYVQG